MDSRGDMDSKQPQMAGTRLEFSVSYLGTFTHKERAAMADDRAPVALCGEYAGLKFSERKYRAKDPRTTAGAMGGIFFGNFKRGARVESIVPMRFKEFGNI
jgi:hypothetical protein